MQIETVLAAIRCATGKEPKHEKPGQWKCLCPAHADAKPSLAVSEGNDGRVLLHCFAGCSPRAICDALGLDVKDLFPPREHDGAGGHEIDATYDYRDAGGNLVYQVVRFHPKDFRCRRPDGAGGWIWDLKGVGRILYKLPTLVAADKGVPVFVVEGEKDADTLATLGMVATCNPGGAGKWHKLADDSILAGRKIFVVPDKDEAGAKHGASVAARLGEIGCDVKVVGLPDEPGVKDVTDWVTLRRRGGE